MLKQELTQVLKKNFIELYDWLVVHDDEEFEVSKRPDKWTTGQHLDHLIRSTAPINQLFKLPKFVLKYKFGVNNRSERSFEETHNRYLDALKNKGIKSFGRFSPSEIKNSQKAQKLSEFKCQGKKFVANINKQSEEHLSKYIIPHPAIGFLTLRELAYFTAFHTAHHHAILKEFH